MILTRAHKDKWSKLEKLFFRFLFSYVTLYILGIFLSALFKPLVIWVAENILSINYDFNQFGYGSGDNTYQYIVTLLYFVISIIAGILWSFIDSKRKSYNNLQYGFLVLIRFVLIYFLLLYGLIKVFHLQMIPPTYTKLMRPLGEMSPMGLAWTFMGYSKGYSIFAGGMEVIAALLLIPRRTVTLGSLVTIGVMLQVFIMNLCFDIPVKLFSLHLLLMGVILFLSNSKRFINAVLLNSEVAKQKTYPTLNKEEKTIISVVKIVLLLVVVAFIGFVNVANTQKRLNSPFAGVWKVTSFSENSKKIPEDYLYKKAWKYMILDTEKSAVIEKQDGSKAVFFIEIDTLHRKISFKETKEAIDNWFNYKKKGTTMHINGILEKDSIEVKLHQKTKKDFLLTNRPFNWINERPYNR